MLSDEDKARIEAEEAYRIETRHRLEARAARPAPSPLEPPRQHSYEFEAAQQIARERAAAAGEKRDPSDTSSESTGTSPLKIFMIAVLALIAAPFLWIIVSSAEKALKTDPTAPKEGTRITFRGVAGPPEVRSSGSAYFDVRGPGGGVTCYYVGGRPPSEGAFVTVGGVVQGWAGSAASGFGTLRPCMIIERE